MKQTAIDWLIEKLAQNGVLHSSDIHKAKEMEKQQIIDAFDAGENSEDYLFPSLKLKENEVYYKETYKLK
jgi:hypothetical protein